MQDQLIRQVVCGKYHTFILKESGELFAFGNNKYGQLGLGDNKNRNVPTLLIHDDSIQQIICGNYNSFILKKSKELFVFGYGNDGQLGLNSSLDGQNNTRYTHIPTLLGLFENIVSINGTLIEKIKWCPGIYSTLSKTKKIEIKNFMLVCYYYKKIHEINMVKYMRHMIVSMLF